MTHDWLKRFAERCLPGPALRAARGTSRWLADRRFGRRLNALRRNHEERNIGIPPDELRLRDGVVLKVTPFIREQYEYFCFRDPDIVAEFDAFARFAIGKVALLDVGAEHGFFSLAFTNSNVAGRRAVAIEPSPVAYPVLLDQLRLNPRASVTPLNLAVGDTEGQIEMAIRGNHAVTAFGFYEDLSAVRRTVPIRTVDAVCHEHSFAPDLMKIDVEGYELSVLRGARGILERCSPLLLLEIHPGMIAALGQTVAELLDFLEQCGYGNVDPKTRRTRTPTVNLNLGSVRLVFRKKSSRF